MELSPEIDKLTDLIDAIWAKSPERIPDELTERDRKDKKDLVAEKVRLCRLRDSLTPKILIEKRNRNVSEVIANLRVQGKK